MRLYIFRDVRGIVGQNTERIIFANSLHSLNCQWLGVHVRCCVYLLINCSSPKLQAPALPKYPINYQWSLMHFSFHDVDRICVCDSFLLLSCCNVR